MNIEAKNGSKLQTTQARIVVPFYVYASFFLLIATLLLFIKSADLMGHYFQPSLLAITHAMALGWGSMVIFGAAHQLVPVLTERPLFSHLLAQLSFYTMAIGIPFLCYGFLKFQLGVVSIFGASLVLAGVLFFVINMSLSISKAKNENVHTAFVLTAAAWLFITVLWGFLLLLNFTSNVFEKNSLFYLSAHAHSGIVGWFLLLVMGVGSRLLPMFLLSKYENKPLLWTVLLFINIGLLTLILNELNPGLGILKIVALAGIALGLGLFGYFCLRAFQKRIKKKPDAQLKLSIAAIGMIMLPLVIILILLFGRVPNEQYVLLYGFSIFFGWITAIIFGMTFKTLPFIIWNKVYHIERKVGAKGKSPALQSLFHQFYFSAMQICYVGGVLLFVAAMLLQYALLIKLAALLLVIAAVFYLLNVLKIVNHKSQLS